MISINYLLKLAIRNVFRNKRRTFLTMMEIMISVGAFLFMFSYFKGITGSLIEDSIKMTGHISIQHPDYRLKERMLSLQVPVNDFSGIRNIIMSGKASDLNVKAITGRISTVFAEVVTAAV